jgi:hypothetical protein
MGIFGAFGRALSGKPAYGPVTPAEQPTPQGEASIPNVRIERVECHVSGDELTVYAEIRNEANEPIFLDKVLLVGAKHELDSQLQAGESRQFLLYTGRQFATPPTGYVELQYRKQNDGDYFASYHTIRSRQEGGEGYIITECLPAGPVKNI